MPGLSWNEIRQRAIRFAGQWQNATSEQSDKQTFWNDFFEVFGLSRRLVATFEQPIRRQSGSTGFIDLLWPKTLLVEHKSAGESLDAAESQAFAYIRALLDSGRRDEAPRYVILSDFRRFALYDLEPEDQRVLPLFENIRYDRMEFQIGELQQHVHSFAFIPGYKIHRFIEQDPINLDAVRIMARLHAPLKGGGYP